MKVKLRSLRSLLPKRKIGRRNKKKSPPAEHKAPAPNDLLSEDEGSSDGTAPTEPPSPIREKNKASPDDTCASSDLLPREAEAEAEVKGGTDDTSDASASELQPKVTDETTEDDAILEDLKNFEDKQEKTSRKAFRVDTIEGDAGSIELKMNEEEKKNTGTEVDNDATARRIKTLLQNAYSEQCFSADELESKSQVLLERYAGREALLFAVLEHKSQDRKEAQTDVDASKDAGQKTSVNIVVSNNPVDLDSDLSTVRIRNDGHATDLPTVSVTASTDDEDKSTVGELNLISIVSNNSNDLDNSPSDTTEVSIASATTPIEDASELKTAPTEDDDNSIVELNRIGTKDYERFLTPTRPLARGGGGERSEITETSGASTSMFSENSLAGSCTDVDEEDVYGDQSLYTEDEDNGYGGRGCDAGCYAIEEHPVMDRLDKMVKTTACDPSSAIDRVDDAAAAGCGPMRCIDE